MKHFSLFLLLLIVSVGSHARVITDDYGRTVTVPDRVKSIYAASPPLTMSVVAFDPALVAALNTPFSDLQKSYVGTAASRPVAGGFFGQGNTPNFEILASVKPDVIILWGKMTGAQNALAKFSSLGIPVLLVRNDTIHDLVSQFDLYGRLTGNTARADKLIGYTEETLALIQKLQKSIDARRKIRYYLAEGADGMSSECEGSFHLEPFRYAGGKNALECTMSSNYGMEKIAMETIVLSDPDIIVAMEKGFADSAAKDPRWKHLRAVKNRRLFIVPSDPFNYITRPPSFMRLLGIRWLIHTFYPDLIAPIEKEKRRFDALFFPAYKG